MEYTSNLTSDSFKIKKKLTIDDHLIIRLDWHGHIKTPSNKIQHEFE